MFAFFAAIALILAAVGVYAVTAYSIVQGTRPPTISPAAASKGLARLIVVRLRGVALATHRLPRRLRVCPSLGPRCRADAGGDLPHGTHGILRWPTRRHRVRDGSGRVR